MILKTKRIARERIGMQFLCFLPYFEIVVLGDCIRPSTDNKIAVVLKQRNVAAMFLIFAQMAQFSNFVNKPWLLVKYAFVVVFQGKSLADPGLPLMLGQHFMQEVFRSDQIYLDSGLIGARCLVTFLLVLFQKTVEAFLTFVILADQLIQFLQIEHFHYFGQYCFLHLVHFRVNEGLYLFEMLKRISDTLVKFQFFIRQVNSIGCQDRLDRFGGTSQMGDKNCQLCLIVTTHNGPKPIVLRLRLLLLLFLHLPNNISKLAKIVNSLLLILPYYFFRQDILMEQAGFSSAKCRQFVEKDFMSSALPSLADFIKIQNVSKSFHTAQEWASYGWDNLEKAAQHVQAWVKNSGVKGVKTEIISDRENDLTPLIFIQVEGQVDETYLFYGHYDKQPPFKGWNEDLGPYKPVLFPNQTNPQKLYGRGGADDGYSAYGSILAIKALQVQGIPHPRCVMIIQGDEQSGSGDVEKHVQKLKDRIGVPKLIFCLDSGALDYSRLWVTTTLRGYLVGKVRVQVLTQGVHSGSSSGIVPNAFRILRLLIDRLENQQTGYMPKELEVDVPPNRYKELYDCAKEMDEAAVRPFPVVEGLGRISPNILQTLLLNGWKPQMVITGLEGYPTLAKAGNVMLPYIEAKFSIRIPPTKNTEEAKAFLLKTLTENPPYNAKVKVWDVAAGHGFNTPDFPEPLQNALEEASQEYFKNKQLTIAEGASIPFMGFLRQLWPSAQFVVTGVLGPESNAHGPNEFLHIPFVKNLICSMAHVLAKTIGKL